MQLNAPAKISSLLSLLLLASFVSCGFIDRGTGELPYHVEPVEDFDDADRPAYRDFDDGTRDYRLLAPWNYNKAWNSGRLYPLVVSLHGSGGDHYAPCIAGDDQESGRDRRGDGIGMCAPQSVGAIAGKSLRDRCFPLPEARRQNVCRRR